MLAEEIEAVVRAIIAAGESYYAEFKSCWDVGPDDRQPRELKTIAADIGEAIVAFANSDGGDLLVGVEDSGAITGVPFDGDRALYLQQSPRHQVKSTGVGVAVHDVRIDGHRVLLFRVQESPGEPVVTAGGRCLWRRGKSTDPVPPSEIERRRAHRRGDTSFESEPIPSATLDDIDTALLRPGPVRIPRFSVPEDPIRALRYWNLLDARNGSIVLRRAALLLFAKEPLRWHPNNRIRLRLVAAGYEGYGPRLGTREDELAGPIVTLLRRSQRVLQGRLEVEARHSELFVTTQRLPQEAVDECLVNALAHRNYAIEGSAIEVLFYPERIEFRSPGRLPEPLTVEDLRAQRGAHRSRNPLIMRVLRDLGWSRDQGEGMKRIFGAMSQVELHEPDLAVEADTFIVRLSTRSLYDDQTRSWLAAYGPYGLEPDERKYLVQLMRADGTLSVDKLARALGESYDQTKKRIVVLERKGIVWHPAGARKYRLVQPLNVPLERALRRLVSSRAAPTSTMQLDIGAVRRIWGAADDRSFEPILDQLRAGGVLVPAGKGKWKPGASLLEYARARR